MKAQRILKRALSNLKIAVTIIEEELRDDEQERARAGVWIAEGDILEALEQIKQFLEESDAWLKKSNYKKQTDLGLTKLKR